MAAGVGMLETEVLVGRDYWLGNWVGGWAPSAWFFLLLLLHHHRHLQDLVLAHFRLHHMPVPVLWVLWGLVV